MTYNFKKHLLTTTATALIFSLAQTSHAKDTTAPTQGTVIRGSAKITTSGSTTTIKQYTDKAIINWKDFSIGSDAAVNFKQNSMDSVTLNRVTGDNVSQIMGRLTATGKIFLINRNGIIFGKNAIVNVGGIIASTANISDDHFWSGNYKFEQPDDLNSSIINNGKITIKSSGIAAFVAPYVANNGVINARLGRVALGATDKAFSLDLYGDNLIKFAISQERASSLGLGSDSKLGVDVSGKIIAQGGIIAISADLAREVVSDVITLNGELRANSISQQGGKIILSGGTGRVNITKAALMDASGTSGGEIVITADRIHSEGKMNARGDASIYQSELAYLYNTNGPQGAIDIVTSWMAGGNVTLKADVITLGGIIDVSGAKGGNIGIESRNMMHYGSLFARGYLGFGGSVNMNVSGSFLGMVKSHIFADGLAGGKIKLHASKNLYYSGTMRAVGAAKDGGDIRITSEKIQLVDGQFNVSGRGNGGQINVGFYQDRSSPDIIANSVVVSPHSIFRANAGVIGGGGKVNFWSQTTTGFWGQVFARGGDKIGDGGFVEISSKGNVGYYGMVNAGANNGAKGTLLLDPKNLTIANAVNPTYFHFTDPNSATGNFGTHMVALSSGNIVITDPNDDFGGSNAGAVYLFDGTSFALISTLTGSRVNDQVGLGGVTALTNGNYVVVSSNWDGKRGAVTWGNGTTGLTGVVSSSNSLIGTSSNDEIGSHGVTALTNGNYVVVSSNWDNGSIADVGAVTWGNGTTGLTGAVSSSNSLIGTTALDYVGSHGVTALTNGNYVVASSNWDNGSVYDVGAVTWGNGTTGITGEVNSSNSLVGANALDYVGLGGVTALTNGNYVVASASWDGKRGAVTWGNGTTGLTGVVSSSNSLIGTSSNDEIGSHGVTALTNGNYVVVSSNWDNGSVADVGAVTWGNGTTGLTGAVSSSNSLIGTTALDYVGSHGVTALTNGNYVVASSNWDNGSVYDVGAVTWGNGTVGITGEVNSSNSLVGANALDYVGSHGVTALTNGNYVVVSSSWNNGSVANVGAVTWGNGTTGLTGAVSSSNSLIGTTALDYVGNKGVTALTNGNYVVVSSNWDNGNVANVRAVTWGNGTTGLTGVVSSSNSLIGASSNDEIGSHGVTALTNGNYVVASPYWDNGSVTDVGAVTWGNGTTGITGVVSSSNSLIGTTALDYVGDKGVTALSNGNYVVANYSWGSYKGAVTWGNGTTGLTGVVSSSNSLVGVNANDKVGNGVVSELRNGIIMLGQKNFGVTGRASLIFDPSLSASSVSFGTKTGQNLTVSAENLTNTLNTGTDLVLQASNDITVNADIIVDNSSGDGGDLTLQAGRSILLNANITTDNGDLTLIANETATNGVVNADRDAGAAQLTMANGTTLNLGTGTATFKISDGSGNNNKQSGDISLETVIAGIVNVTNSGNDKGDIIINQQITASASGNAIIMRTDGSFTNNAGASGLNATNGRYVVFIEDYANITKGGLTAKNWYNTATHVAVSSVTGTGNRFVSNNLAKLTIKADDKSRTYGANNPIFTQTVTGYINGEDSSILTGTIGTTTSAATVSTNVGAATISADKGTLATDYNYTFSTTDGTLTITKASLAIRADNQVKTYGDALTLDQTDFSSSGLKNGETIGAVILASQNNAAGNTSANAGTYGGNITASSASAGTFSAANYDITYVNGELKINKASLAITADNQVKTYGDALTLDQTDFSSSGLKNGETIGAVILASQNNAAGNTSANAGTYGGNIKVNSATGTFSAANYDITYVNGELKINKASLAITADNQVKTYGDALTLDQTDFSSSGLKNGETIGAVILASQNNAAGSTSANAGTYGGNITASSASAGTFSAANYDITYVNSELKINKASLAIRADNQVKTYGDALTLDQTDFSSSGLKNGETIGAVILASQNNAAGSTSANAGTYGGNITASSASAGTFSAANYDITYVNSELKINKASLAITADNQVKTYGDALTLDQTDFSSSGLKNGETIGAVILASQNNAAGNTSANAGTYGGNITASSASAGTFSAANYDITYVNGELKINKASLAITADNQVKTYGDALTLDQTDFSSLGLKNGETIGAVILASQNNTAGNTSANAGTYGGNITASSASAGTFSAANYDITYVNSELKINKASLAITADNQVKTYGDALTLDQTDFSSSGLKNGETIGAVILASQNNAAGNTSANAGTYGGNITASSASAGTFSAANYDITYVNSELKINKASLAITADNQVKTYGDALTLDQIDFSSSGLKNGETIGAVILASQNNAAGNTSANAGTYGGNITASSASAGTFSAANYDITYVNSELKINKASLAITADNQVKTYGDALTLDQIDFSSSGLKNGETIGAVILASQNNAAGNTSANAGTYGGNITASSASAGTFSAANYDITYVNSELKINKASLAIRADNQVKTYGDALTLDQTDFSSSGLKNGETIGAVILASQNNAAGSTSANAGTYGGNITASSASAGTFSAANYDITYVNGELKINKASLAITADNQVKTYGDALTLDQTDFSSSGLKNGETIGAVILASQNNAAGNTSANAGTYGGNITASSASAGTFSAANYDITYVNSELKINKASLAIRADNQVKTYGDALTLDQTDFSSSGLKNGETIGAVILASQNNAAGNTSANAGTYGGNITASSASTGTFSAANYDITYVNGELKINKASLAIRADNQVKTYGDALTLDQTDFSSSGLKNGETIGAVILASQNNAAGNTSANAGTYGGNIKVNSATGTFSAANYDITYVNGELKINKASLAITVDNQVKTYGDALTLDQTDFSSSGLKNGETIGAVILASQNNAAGNRSANAGTYGGNITASSASAGTFSAANYDITYVNGELKINKASLAIRADNQVKTYGDALTLDQTDFSSSGLKNGETIGAVILASQNNAAGSTSANAGTYGGNIKVNSATGTFSAANYDITYVNGELKINKASLAITADNQVKTYGDALTLDQTDFSSSGLKNGETIGAVILASQNNAAGSTSANAGTYGGNIKVNSATGTFSAANYDITYVNGELKINKASLAITADNQVKTYGDALTLDQTDFSSSGLKNGETIGAVILASQNNAAGNTSANAGTYGGNIKVNSATGTFSAANYDITYVNGELKINKAALTITVDNQVKTYGDALTLDQTDFSSSGLKNGETIGAVILASQNNAAGSTSANAGTYGGNITASSASAGTFSAANYDITYVNSELKINKASLAITADNQVKTYGDALTLDQTDFSSSGLKNGETIGAVILASQNNAAGSTSANAGTYGGNIKVNSATGTFSAANYDITYVNGELKINKASLAITADNQVKTYGDALTLDQTDFSSSGLKNGETIGAVILASQNNAAGNTSANAGTYGGNIKVNSATGTFSAANYDITYVNGELKINKAALTITVDNQVKTYGDALTLDQTDFSSSGLKNGETIGAVILASQNNAAGNRSANAGTYGGNITASSASAGTFSAANYDITYVNGELKINKASLAIRADNQVKTYGDALTLDQTDFSSSGLKNGETIGAVIPASQNNAAGNTSANAGTYDNNITASSASAGTFSADNYNITYVKADLKVNKAPVTITANDQVKVYGDVLTLDQTAFSAAGLKNGETIGAVILASQNNAAGNTSANAGTYDNNITANSASAGTFSTDNYDIAYVDGDLKINELNVVKPNLIDHPSYILPVKEDYIQSPITPMTAKQKKDLSLNCSEKLQEVSKDWKYWILSEILCK